MYWADIRFKTLDKNIKFSSEYRSLGKKSYLSDMVDNITPIELGKENVPRQCWLCLKLDGETTFTKDSHVIPAFLGNRIFYSYEECDICNDDFYESAFADYTLPPGVWKVDH